MKTNTEIKVYLKKTKTNQNERIIKHDTTTN